MKAIYSAFKDRPEAIIQAVKFAAEAPEGTTDEQVVGAIQEQLDVADQKAIIDENAALKAKVSELEAKIAELSPEAAKVAELSAKIAEQSGQLAEFAKKTARFGIRPINTGKPATVAAPEKLTAEQFSAKSPLERASFRASGGIIE